MEISVIVSLMGGLGLFLLGMKQMSDGLEKAAGAKMRSILEAVTTNRFLGTLVGILFCAVIQSSSATTVMVVSFVNAGMMTLYQAAGVIMGANIGTTVTSQLVSFNLSAYAPVFLFIGVLMTQFVKNDRIKKIGEVVLGFRQHVQSEGFPSGGESFRRTEKSASGCFDGNGGHGDYTELLCDRQYPSADGSAGTSGAADLLLHYTWM